MKVLMGFFEKAVGLLGTDEHAESVLIVGCSSIHTIGMRYALDVAFLSRQGDVLKVCRSLGPGKLASCRGARVVVERPADDGGWLCVGDHVALAAYRTGKLIMRLGSLASGPKLGELAQTAARAGGTDA